jgi:two-component system LytT family response regulator
MIYKCLIVDDETPAHKVIASHIHMTKNFEISGSAYNGKEALDFLTANKVDIVFLDIEMPKLSGVELIECMPYKPAVILVSAYNNFGFEAYQNDVIDYLLKPVSYPRFLKAVNKAIKYLAYEQIAEYTEIELRHEGVLRKINTEDLVYIQSIGNYIKLFFEKEKPLLIQQTMKYIESLLPPSYFVRVHKSYIVKRNCISSVSKTEISLKDKIRLPLGRKYSVLLESQ